MVGGTASVISPFYSLLPGSQAFITFKQHTEYPSYPLFYPLVNNKYYAIYFYPEIHLINNSLQSTNLMFYYNEISLLVRGIEG